MKSNACHDFRYTLFVGNDRQHYFNLKGSNGEIILQSEGYTSKQGAENGKAAVKRYAPSAETEDLATAAA